MNEIFNFQKLYRAYLACRQNKRNTINALKFEWDLERNLFQLLQKLQQRTYQPGRSICFAVEKPTPREIFAASFKDRVIHHLLINELLELGERNFIFDSYACRKNKGTHKAVKRLQGFISIDSRLRGNDIRGGNDRRNSYYLQLDIAGFFMSIDHHILYSILKKLVFKQKRSQQWKDDILWLSKTIIFSKPTENYLFKGDLPLFESIPKRKSLFYSPKDQGLPIGNYSSQFFANLYLNELDQFIKRKLQCRHYVRYVDDLILLSNSKQELKSWLVAIETFLKENLNMKINSAKTKFQPLVNGVDFLGYFIKPKYTLVRKRVVKRLKEKIGGFINVIPDLIGDPERLDSRFRGNDIRGGNDREGCHPGLKHCHPELDSGSIQIILAIINSYFGHFRFANSFNLRKDIFINHLGKLKTYFQPKANFSALRCVRAY
jgi:hypothetical protein